MTVPSLDLKLAMPPGLELNCAGAPHQLPLNFGGQPPRMTLARALTIVAERTQAAGSARVYVAPDVLQDSVAATLVDPPSGAQPSLVLVQQLLAQAQASSSIGICLVPEGGYRIRRLQ